MNIILITTIVLLAVGSGPLISGIPNTSIRRASGWLTLIILTITAHYLMHEETPLYRMVGLCCVLLGSMKALVYAEWAQSKKLTATRYLIFSLLWFGMDPDSFIKKRYKLTWHNDLLIGITLMLIGTLSAWIIYHLQWNHVLVMFLPMSIGFHFGALRVLKATHRAAGFPVRTLFPNPIQTDSISDFWSKRWNVGYSQMLQRTLGRPISNKIGQNTALLAIFLLSGLLHEIAITIPCRSGYGLPTLFFTIHGLLSLAEKTFRFRLGKIPTLLAVILPMPLLFPPPFQAEVIKKCLSLVF